MTNTTGGKLLRRPSSYKKLLDKVTFCIAYIALRVGYKIVAYNATFVGMGRRTTLFCVCSRKCIVIVIINIIVVLVCQNCQVTGLNKCKHEISDSLHCSIFFILFYYAVLHTDPHVNKDFSLLEFFSKVSLSCCKVGATHV